MNMKYKLSNFVCRNFFALLYFINFALAQKIGIYNICYYDYCYFRDFFLNNLEKTIIEIFKKKGYEVLPWKDIEIILDKYEILNHKKISYPVIRLFENKLDYLLLINVYESSPQYLVLGAKVIDTKTGFIIWSNILKVQKSSSINFLAGKEKINIKKIANKLIGNIKLKKNKTIFQINFTSKKKQDFLIFYPKKVFLKEKIPVLVAVLNLKEKVNEIFFLKKRKKHYLINDFKYFWEGYINTTDLKEKNKYVIPFYALLKNNKIKYIGSANIKIQDISFDLKIKINKNYIGLNQDLFIEISISPIYIIQKTQIILENATKGIKKIFSVSGCPEIVKIPREILNTLPDGHYKIMVKLYTNQGKIIKSKYINIIISHTPPAVRLSYNQLSDFFIINIKYSKLLTSIRKLKVICKEKNNEIVLLDENKKINYFYLPLELKDKCVLIVIDYLNNKIKVPIKLHTLKLQKTPKTNIKHQKKWLKNF